jgi:hypothetical protein
MIDMASRRQLIQMLMELAEGSLARDRFEAQRPRSKDLAVREVAGQAWLLFEDLRQQTRTGRYRLARDDRRDVERWILFLESEREYRWPALPRWARIIGFVPSILTFGLLWRPYRFWFERQGDFRVWPFRDRSELDEARATRPSRRSHHLE